MIILLFQLGVRRGRSKAWVTLRFSSPASNESAASLRLLAVA